MQKVSPFLPAVCAASALSLLSLGLSARAYAATLYVAATGKDTNTGNAADAALRTLKAAADRVEPGDTVLIGDGTYTNTDTGDGSAVLTLSDRAALMRGLRGKRSPVSIPLFARPDGRGSRFALPIKHWKG